MPPRYHILLAARVAVMALVVVAGSAACGDGEPRSEPRPPEHDRAVPPATPQVPEEGGAVRGATSVPSATAEASPAPRELLPDLQIMEPRELYIEAGAERRLLRFSTTVVNAGDGPLDITGSVDAVTGITTATQRVHRADGMIVEREAGRFVFHAGHTHWHFEDFTMLEVWSHDGDGELEELRASTGKATFCAVDEIPEYEDLANFPEGPAFLECGQGVQGLSVGYSDTYTADLIGQELDISGLPDGRYAVRTIADPADRLVETTEDNNALVVYVELRGDVVEMRDGP